MEYPVLLLGEQLQEVEKRLAAALQKCDEDFLWADEVLAACKATFTSTEIELMPKTPSFKKPTRQAAQKKKVLEDEEDYVKPPLRNRRARKVTVEKSASPLSTRSGRPTRSTQASRASTRSSNASTHNGSMSSQVTCSMRSSRSSCQLQKESHESLATSPVPSTTSAASGQSRRGTKKDSSAASNTSLRSTRASRTLRHKQQSQAEATESGFASHEPGYTSKTRSSKGEDVVSSTPQASTQGKDGEETPAATLATLSPSQVAGTSATVKHAGSPSLKEEHFHSITNDLAAEVGVSDGTSTTPMLPNSSVSITPPTLTRATSAVMRAACPGTALASTISVKRSSSSHHHHSPRLVSTKAKRTSSISGPRMGTAKTVSDAGRVSLKRQKRSSSLKSRKEDAMEVDEQPMQANKPNRTKLHLQKNAAKKNSVSSSSSSSEETSTHPQSVVPTAASAQPSSKNNAHSTHIKTHNVEVNASAMEENSQGEENSRLEEADTQVPGDGGGAPSKRRKLNRDQGTEQWSQDAGRIEGDESKTVMDAKEQSSAEKKRVTDDASKTCRTRTRVKQQGKNATATSSSSIESIAAAEPGHSTRSKSPIQDKNQSASVNMDTSSSAFTATSADDEKEERTQLRACTKTVKSTAAPADENASRLSEVAASTVHEKEDIMARTKTRTKSRKPATAAAETSSLLFKDRMSFSTGQREETSTRTKTRTKTRKPAANPSYVIPVISGSSDEEGQMEMLVRQSQRTKTRKPADNKVGSSPVQEEKKHHARQTEDSVDSGILSTQPSCEDLLRSQQEEPEMMRLTRTKTRELKTTVVQADSSAVSQSTRTKTRKRQAEESEQDLPPCHKHACTEASFTKVGNTTKEITFDLTEMDVDKSWEKDSDMVQTPSPPGVTGKVVQPHPSSFLNTLRSQKTTPSNLVASSGSSGRIMSFIKRKTPIRIMHKTKLEMKQKELLEKQKKEEERLKNREERMKQRSEAIKQKREERLKRAAKQREMQQKKTQQFNSEIARKMEILQTTDKSKEEKIREQLREKAHNRLKKQTEAEERRKLEEQERLKKQMEMEEEERRQAELMKRKREFEEAERQRRLAEERQKQEERRAEIARERELEAERLRLQELERDQEKMKEEREKAAIREKVEREKTEQEKKKEREAFLQSEMQKLKDLEARRLQLEKQKQEEAREQQEEVARILSKHNQHLQTLAAKLTTAAANTDSYPITPTKKNYDNYDISQLGSGDETDDDEHPRKPIPAWAQGSQLKVALINQCYHPPDLDKLFPPVQMPDLSQLFFLQRPRFRKRTSSACWDSPLSKHF